MAEGARGTRPDLDRVKTAWRALSRAFPTWSLPFTAAYSPGSWTFFGNDLITAFWRSGTLKRAQAAFAGLDQTDLAALRRLAELNVRRGEYSFRFTAAGFVTIPVGALLALAELAPDLMERYGADLGRSILTVLVTWVVFTGFFYAGLWRMRQMAHAVELEEIARGSATPPPSARVEDEPEEPTALDAD